MLHSAPLPGTFWIGASACRQQQRYRLFRLQKQHGVLAERGGERSRQHRFSVQYQKADFGGPVRVRIGAVAETGKAGQSPRLQDLHECRVATVIQCGWQAMGMGIVRADETGVLAMLLLQKVIEYE